MQTSKSTAEQMRISLLVYSKKERERFEAPLKLNHRDIAEKPALPYYDKEIGTTFTPTTLIAEINAIDNSSGEEDLY